MYLQISQRNSAAESKLRGRGKESSCEQERTTCKNQHALFRGVQFELGLLEFVIHYPLRGHKTAWSPSSLLWDPHTNGYDIRPYGSRYFAFRHPAYLSNNDPVESIQ